jgi:hypothetical protein
LNSIVEIVLGSAGFEKLRDDCASRLINHYRKLNRVLQVSSGQQAFYLLNWPSLRRNLRADSFRHPNQGKKTSRNSIVLTVDDTADHSTEHSESGWTAAETFFTFWILREYLNDGQLFWLRLDCYSVHRSKDIKKYAEKIGIKLLFIPARMTDPINLWIVTFSA